MKYTPSSPEEVQFLASYNPRKYGPGADLTADMVLISVDTHTPMVLMIRRKNFPYQNHLALPGGFVNMDETPEQAATRELQEETMVTLENPAIYPTGVYADPDRDPRGRMVSFAFATMVSTQDITPQAADDAAEVIWVPLEEAISSGEVAFDHGNIIEQAFHTAQNAYLEGYNNTHNTPRDASTLL